MPRFAAIDVGTNSVLLLVAEREASGKFVPVVERAEITRLGKGVDKTKKLSADAMLNTIGVIEQFVTEAKAQGVEAIAITATSAARDASNGAEFLSGVKAATGQTVEIISGDEEARLSFASAWSDFGSGKPLAVIDIGGGSTEIIFGTREGTVGFKRSFDVGSVRLTERVLLSDPPARVEVFSVRAQLKSLFAGVPRQADCALVGIAGTVTTLLSISEKMQTYDASKVHGAKLTRERVHELSTELLGLTIEERRALPGLQPKRADVIAAGALILDEAMLALKMPELIVSDRGLRWGLLATRYGNAS